MRAPAARSESTAEQRLHALKPVPVPTPLPLEDGKDVGEGSEHGAGWGKAKESLDTLPRPG